jgi:hypothetical protein
MTFEKSERVQQAARDDSNSSRRKGYDKPRIVYREKLEAAASACGSTFGGKAVTPNPCNISGS